MICRNCGRLLKPCPLGEECAGHGYIHTSTASHLCQSMETVATGKMAEPDPEFKS